MATVFNFQTNIHICQANINFITWPPILYFASAHGSRVGLVINKMFCPSVMIEGSFNVKTMLNMPRINIENRIRQKSIILFGVSHRDVASLLGFFHTTVYR